MAWTTLVNLARSVGRTSTSARTSRWGLRPSPCWSLWRRPPRPRNDPASRGRRWQALHRLIYVSAIAGWCIIRLVKADVSSPQRCPLIVGGLLPFRLLWARSHATAPPVRVPQALPRATSLVPAGAEKPCNLGVRYVAAHPAYYFVVASGRSSRLPPLPRAVVVAELAVSEQVQREEIH